MTEFMSHRAAAKYLGLGPGAFRSSVLQGTGPRPDRDQLMASCEVRLVFTRDELDRWLAAQPSQGESTD